MKDKRLKKNGKKNPKSSKTQTIITKYQKAELNKTSNKMINQETTEGGETVGGAGGWLWGGSKGAHSLYTLITDDLEMEM